MLEFLIDDRISMRTFTESDAGSLFQVVDGNRSHLREWLPWLDRNTSVRDSLQFIQSTIVQYEQDKGFVCGIYFERKLVGTCGYHSIENIEEGVAIGYWLAQSAIGHGIVSKCTSFLIDYAFDTLRLVKVNIPVAVQNNRSRAVCERLGFKSEGIKKKAENLYGVYVDHVVYFTTPEHWALYFSQT